MIRHLAVLVAVLSLAISAAMLPRSSSAADNVRVFLPLVSKATSDAPPTQPPPSSNTVRVLSSSHYLATLGNSSSDVYWYVIAGEVINESDARVYGVQLAATFYDAAGNQVAEATGYTILSETLPGERTPFLVILSDPPASIASHTVAITSWRTSPLSPTTRFGRPTIVSQTFHPGDPPIFEPYFTGSVRNHYGEGLLNVIVGVTVYDATGKVVDVFLGIVPESLSLLAPGQTAEFGASRRPFNPSLQVHTFTVKAEGLLMTR